jgi:hypothetical protein
MFPEESWAIPTGMPMFADSADMLFGPPPTTVWMVCWACNETEQNATHSPTNASFLKFLIKLSKWRFAGTSIQVSPAHLRQIARNTRFETDLRPPIY